MNLDLKLLFSDEVESFQSLITVFSEVFEMPYFKLPDTNHLQSLLAQPNFLVIVAKVDLQIVGGVTAYVLDQYYPDKPLVYIYDLGVVKSFQRKGIGKRIMQYLLTQCKEKGFYEVFVQADKSDRGALMFYRSIKPLREDPVVHFSFNLETV
ncbi:MAG: GNAT family N-acetyltransferase [Niastella sp.]|uniref:GNAT family N-acetyltransferase n=1 Tax=Niastella sp. TaxID=1869183 RepID=UPI00389A941F